MFQYDGLVVRSLSRIGDMIILNALWLLCCIPVVTAGPATTAAQYVALKFVRDEGTSVIRMFFHSFRRNFRQSLVLGIIAQVLGSVLVVDLWLVLTGRIAFSPQVRLVLLALLWLFLFLYLILMIYVWAVMARFENTIKMTVFNACILAIANIRVTLMMLCWDVALVTAAVLSAAYVPQLAVLCIIFGLPALFILNGTRLRPLLDQCAERSNIDGHACNRRKQKDKRWH